MRQIEETMTQFHEITMNRITGEPRSFAAFKGKRCLVVNVASK